MLDARVLNEEEAVCSCGHELASDIQEFVDYHEFDDEIPGIHVLECSVCGRRFRVRMRLLVTAVYLTKAMLKEPE